jgi:hypothetical protein
MSKEIESFFRDKYKNPKTLTEFIKEDKEERDEPRKTKKQGKELFNRIKN